MHSYIGKAVLGALLVGLGVAEANACNGCDPSQSTAACREYILGNVTPPVRPKRADVIIDGFITEGAQSGESCAVAITGLHLADVVGVEVLNEKGEPLEGFKLYPDSAPAATLQGVANFRHGFSGKVAKNIPTGTKTKLLFRLKLKDDVDIEDLNRDLRGAAFAVGAAHADGRFSGEHVDIRTLHGGKVKKYASSE